MTHSLSTSIFSRGQSTPEYHPLKVQHSKTNTLEILHDKMHIESWNKSTTSSTSQTSNPITFTYILQIKTSLIRWNPPFQPLTEAWCYNFINILLLYTSNAYNDGFFRTIYLTPPPSLWHIIHHEYFDNKFDMIHWLLVPYISVDFDSVERHMPHAQTWSPRPLSRLLHCVPSISSQFNAIMLKWSLSIHKAVRLHQIQFSPSPAHGFCGKNKIHLLQVRQRYIDS